LEEPFAAVQTLLHGQQQDVSGEAIGRFPVFILEQQGELAEAGVKF
jgi:hypothetical protein